MTALNSGSPFSWVDAAMEGVEARVGQMMETEAAREPEEGEARRRSMSTEELRKKYSWWPSGYGKERSTYRSWRGTPDFENEVMTTSRGECSGPWKPGS